MPGKLIEARRNEMKVRDFCEIYGKSERYIQNVVKITFPDITKQGLATVLTPKQSDILKDKLESLIKISLKEAKEWYSEKPLK